jgi:hypothetical protein
MKTERFTIICTLIIVGFGISGVNMAAEALKKGAMVTVTVSPIPPARAVAASAPYMIAGRLTDLAGPLVGKTITLTGTSPTITGTQTTDERGYYIFELIAPNKPGAYKVIIQYVTIPPNVIASANTVLTVTPAIQEPLKKNN